MTWDSIQNSYDVSTKTTSWEDASAMDKVTDNLIDFVILLIIMCYLQTIPYRFRVAKSAKKCQFGHYLLEKNFFGHFFMSFTFYLKSDIFKWDRGNRKRNFHFLSFPLSSPFPLSPAATINPTLVTDCLYWT